MLKDIFKKNFNTLAYLANLLLDYFKFYHQFWDNLRYKRAIKYNDKNVRGLTFYSRIFKLSFLFLELGIFLFAASQGSIMFQFSLTVYQMKLKMLFSPIKQAILTSRAEQIELNYLSILFYRSQLLLVSGNIYDSKR